MVKLLGIFCLDLVWQNLPQNHPQLSKVHFLLDLSLNNLQVFQVMQKYLKCSFFEPAHVLSLRLLLQEQHFLPYQLFALQYLDFVQKKSWFRK